MIPKRQHMTGLELPEALRLSVMSDQDCGPQRRLWLDRLPGIVASLASRWALTPDRPFQPGGCTSWVAPARSDAGSRVVVKICWCPPDAEELHEAEGLRVWAGRGTVRLLDAVRLGDASALLLEACEPGTTLSDAALPAAEQDVIAAGLLRRLWIDPPAGHPFRPLMAMCDMWATQFETEWRAAPAELRIEADLAQAGVSLLHSLPGSGDQAVLLTTDLHPDNILAAEREPWLIIDPKPYVGDPSYDPVQYMLNFTERLTADPHAFADRMAGLLGVDPRRVRLWLFARCVQESGNDPELRTVAARLAP